MSYGILEKNLLPSAAYRIVALMGALPSVANKGSANPKSLGATVFCATGPVSNPCIDHEKALA